MRCPACTHVLKEIAVDDITVDACVDGCGGIWFDRFELQKVDEPHESAGEQLLNIERDPEVNVDHNLQRYCPRCGDMLMMRHFYNARRKTEVDECPQCGGFWVDFGELATIRKHFATEEERKAFAGEYFADIFDQELMAMRHKSDEKLEKANHIARMFRFICPSYYLPGKQSWGAF